MSSSLQRSVLLGGREEPAGSDSMSESGASAGGGGGGAAGGIGGVGGGGGSRDGEFLQHAAAVLDLPLADMFADRVRVDRRRLEGLITGDSESKETAQAFFDRLEEQTRTRILWPSHLKIGSRSRKSPHVHIAGLMEDVLQAKKEVMAVLDSPDVRVTMKIDVSYLYHSHIIGRGGLVIKQVMEETGTHIHFPDSNRTSTTDKSSQVSLSGKLAGVEQARQRVRNLMPLVFLFDVPALGDAAMGAECASPIVMRLQQQLNVQVRIRHRHRLRGVQVQVKGSELEVTHVTEATLFLIQHLCVNAAEKVQVYTTLEIPPHHQPLVLGINCSNIKTIMNHTSTQIMVPDLNDPYIPQIKKNIITVQGPIKNVYLARQMLLGSLPILLLFEISDNTTVDFNSVAEVMYDLDVQISFRQKEKQKTFAVSIKGIERDASNVYEARRRILGLEGHRVVAEVPATYHIPNAPPVFRHALGRGRGGAGAGASAGVGAGAGPGPGVLAAERRRAPSPDAEAEALLAERWESPYEQLTRNVSAVLRRQAAAAAASSSGVSSAAPSRSTTPASGTGSVASAAPAPAAPGASGLRGSQSSLLSVASWLSSSTFAPNQQRPDSGYAASSSAASSLAPSPYPCSGRTSPSSASAASASPLASPGSAVSRSAAATASAAVTSSATPTATTPAALASLTSLTPGSGSASAVSDEAFGSPLGAEDLADPSPASAGFLSGSVSEFPDMVHCPDRRAPGYEKAKSRELAAAAATAAAATASDYRRQLALAFKAMQEPPVASQPRVPTSSWSGMGFSRSSPVSSPAPASPPRGATIAAAEAQSLWRSSPGPLALRLPQVTAPLWGHEAPWPPDTTTPNHPTPADVVELLTSLGLHKYIDLFQREEIDLQAFRTLTEMDLLEIGITAVGARRKMLSAISALEAGRLFYGHGGPTSEQMVSSDGDTLTTPNLYNR